MEKIGNIFVKDRVSINFRKESSTKQPCLVHVKRYDGELVNSSIDIYFYIDYYPTLTTVKDYKS